VCSLFRSDGPYGATHRPPQPRPRTAYITRRTGHGEQPSPRPLPLQHAPRCFRASRHNRAAGLSTRPQIALEDVAPTIDDDDQLMITPPVIVRVTCPLCGEEIGPLRGNSDWPLSLFQSVVVSQAFEHCYERHPKASGVTWFHVESDWVKSARPVAARRVTALQFDGLQPVPLPVPLATRRLIQRRKKAHKRHSVNDARFLATLRESGPAAPAEISRRINLDSRRTRWCADRLLKRELIERLMDGRYQAR
jgi:hypothetical protein